MDTDIQYPEDIKMLQCFGINEIYQISNSQNKALMTPLSCLVIAHPI
jgi:hypothetical protein